MRRGIFGSAQADRPEAPPTAVDGSACGLASLHRFACEVRPAFAGSRWTDP